MKREDVKREKSLRRSCHVLRFHVSHAFARLALDLNWFPASDITPTLHNLQNLKLVSSPAAPFTFTVSPTRASSALRPIGLLTLTGITSLVGGRGLGFADEADDGFRVIVEVEQLHGVAEEDDVFGDVVRVHTTPLS